MLKKKIRFVHNEGMKIITTLCGRTFITEITQNTEVFKDTGLTDNATSDQPTKVGIAQRATYIPE